MEIPPPPDMTEDEILDRAEKFLGGELNDMDYAEIVKALTVASYVSDICIRVLGDRNLLELMGDMPAIPDARPEHMFVDNVLNVRPEDWEGD